LYKSQPPAITSDTTDLKKTSSSVGKCANDFTHRFAAVYSTVAVSIQAIPAVGFMGN
jgi:hypothetical protein